MQINNFFIFSIFVVFIKKTALLGFPVTQSLSLIILLISFIIINLFKIIYYFLKFSLQHHTTLLR